MAKNPETTLSNMIGFALSRSEQSSWGLREKLLSKMQAKHPGLDPAESAGLIDAALSRAVASGALDDLRWAKMKMRPCLVSRGMRFALSKMKSLGAPKELVERAVEALVEDGDVPDEDDAMRLAWESKYKSPPKDFDEQKKQAAFLIRRGFSPSKAFKLVKELAKR